FASIGLLPPSAPLFPYTTLFRSERVVAALLARLRGRRVLVRGRHPRGSVHVPRGVRRRHPRGALRPLRRRRLRAAPGHPGRCARDRKSTRLNSSHVKISYAVFCL